MRLYSKWICSPTLETTYLSWSISSNHQANISQCIKLKSNLRREASTRSLKSWSTQTPFVTTMIIKKYSCRFTNTTHLEAIKRSDKDTLIWALLRALMGHRSQFKVVKELLYTSINSWCNQESHSWTTFLEDVKLVSMWRLITQCRTGQQIILTLFIIWILRTIKMITQEPSKL